MTDSKKNIILEQKNDFQNSENSVAINNGLVLINMFPSKPTEFSPFPWPATFLFDSFIPFFLILSIVHLFSYLKTNIIVSILIYIIFLLIYISIIYTKHNHWIKSLQTYEDYIESKKDNEKQINEWNTLRTSLEKNSFETLQLPILINICFFIFFILVNKNYSIGLIVLIGFIWFMIYKVKEERKNYQNNNKLYF